MIGAVSLISWFAVLYFGPDAALPGSESAVGRDFNPNLQLPIPKRFFFGSWALGVRVAAGVKYAHLVGGLYL